MTTDPKPEPRTRDVELLRALHHEWRTCALEDLGGCERLLSLHHVLKHPRDDLRENLVMLCGSGTTGHHGLIEAENPIARAALGAHLRRARPDVIDHIARRLGGQEAAAEWLRRRLYAPA